MAVAVVTHTAPATLPLVLSALATQAPFGAVTVLFTGAPGSTAHTRAHRAAAAVGACVDETGTPLRIGAARAWHLTHLAATAPHLTHVAFLDDDCPPRPGWWMAALAAADGGAVLAFGPRHPARPQGAGGRIRAWEAESSAKVTAARTAPTLVRHAPSMMVAGGNMLVDLRVAHAHGITAPAFACGAFEDVDYQLRLAEAGFADRIRFDPRMATDHHDHLGARALLYKSALSGQGLARCRTLHGARLWNLSRWRPCRTLLRTCRSAYGAHELPYSLRLLTLVRAATVAAAYTAARLHQLAALRARDRDHQTPPLHRDAGGGLQLGGAPLTPAEQVGGVGG
ncbi:hypothetical protein KSE_16640 [Kitasatospora setae KM-6054]|uniref:Glycosyltransferase n=1 Tax=Kitasatospora setae (strain ATCC 33774 / DSM 43861 / JCM 3304 / KCC A-0304 / NBRC 14216 / KM-6054) TaxID=452652 RepID=E4N8F8_KITSK|nr:hypothetical protein KSE_16640 [Kitasatospora setae KM-6054]